MLFPFAATAAQAEKRSAPRRGAVDAQPDLRSPRVGATMTAAHPYIPNSAPETRKAMLEQVGVVSIDELFASIPDRLRAPADLGLPPALPSESAAAPVLRRRARRRTPTRATTCRSSAAAAGRMPCRRCATRSRRAGSSPRPSWGSAGASTSGAYQALFEYQSLIAELVGLDVSRPRVRLGLGRQHRVADGRSRDRSAAGAGRRHGRPRAAAADRRAAAAAGSTSSAWRSTPGPGRSTSTSCGRRVDGAAALYFENPSYLGVVESAARGGAEVTAASRLPAGRGRRPDVARRDPRSGRVRRGHGRAATCSRSGITQPSAARRPAYVATTLDDASSPSCRRSTSSPSRRVARASTTTSGATSSPRPTRRAGGRRRHRLRIDDCRDRRGRYLSLMGPAEWRELGDALRAGVQYLAGRLAAIPGVSTTRLTGIPFKELVVDFSGSGCVAGGDQRRPARARHLRRDPAAGEFPELAGCALYSVTEEHTRDDLDRLATALEELLR